VGKSQIVAQIAADLDWQFLDIRAVQLDPVDLRGLPRISADQAEWEPPKFLPTSGKGILFLDELTAAPQMTQAGCYQLVLAGISRDVQVVCRSGAVCRNEGRPRKRRP
jgi:MoxR-like ATPase